MTPPKNPQLRPFASEHPSEGEWMAWIDGELSAHLRAPLDAHYQACRSCNSLADELRAAASAAKSMPPLPTGFLHDAKMDFLAALPAVLQRTPTPAQIRICLGSDIAARLGAHPDDFHGAVRTLIGNAAAPGVLRVLPPLVWLASSLFFAAMLIAWTLWMSTGDWNPMAAVFGSALQYFLSFAAAAGTILAFFAMRQFESRSLIHSAWLLLFVGGGCRFLGTVFGLAPTQSALLPAAQFIGGPVAVVALGFGLLYVYSAYRCLALTRPLSAGDWLVIAAGVLFTVRHLVEVAGILFSGATPSLFTFLNWFSDPASLFVLVVAVRLRRAAVSHNGGLLANCWSAMAAGALLTFIGNALLYLTNYGYLVWPWNSIAWFVWVPAFTAFALGPAYQLAACGTLALSNRFDAARHPVF